MDNHNKYFETNANTWDTKVAVHAQSDFYGLEDFKKGKSSLNSFEVNALGDVSGKKMLHLQCHFGQDTLSWSRLGASCTGVDISKKGIDLAQQLAKELEIEAKFVCCNVLDTSKHISETYDIVFTSYGTIGWLPDLQPWANMISERLKPGGVFYIVEFHPIVWMFDYLQTPPQLQYGYQQKEVIYDEYKGTYADMEAPIVSKEYGWNHGLSEVVNTLIEAGLTIEYLDEYDESPYEVFPNMVKNDREMFETKDQLYPLLFAIKAFK